MQLEPMITYWTNQKHLIPKMQTLQKNQEYKTAILIANEIKKIWTPSKNTTKTWHKKNIYHYNIFYPYQPYHYYQKPKNCTNTDHNNTYTYLENKELITIQWLDNTHKKHNYWY